MTRGLAPLTAIGLLFLGVGNILLLTLTVAEILQNDDVRATKIDWTPKLSTGVERVAGIQPLGAYPQTVARPVFFRTRQPFVPPPPPPPPQPPVTVRPPPAPPPAVDTGLVLGGVMISGEIKKVYLLTKRERTGAWLTEGEQFMGWSVRSIDSGSTALRKDGRNIKLWLYPAP